MEVLEQEIGIEVSDPQAAILSSTASVNLFMAGVGSGKSHTIAINTSDIIINNPELIQFVGANTYQQISKSTLKRVFDVWQDKFNWEKDRDFVVDKIPPKRFERYAAAMKSYDNTICFENGAMLYTASLDNYKVIDGTEFAIAHLDETKDTKEEAVKEVISSRLRQSGLWTDASGNIYNKTHQKEYIKSGKWVYTEIKGARVLLDIETLEEIRSFNPLYIYTSPAKVDWINEWFGLSDQYEEINRLIHSKTTFYHKQNRDQCVVISSTFHNEHNLPDGFITELLRKYAGTPNRIEMLVYGSPIAQTGGEYAHKFERMKHVKPTYFREGLPVHISLDFNVKPYMTCICAQYVSKEDDGRKKLRIFREYCLKQPRNSTEDICSALVSEYGTKLRGLFYYGDPSGRNKQTVSKEYKDNYDVVEKKLRKYLNNGSDRVLTRHPGLLDSRDFLNNLLAGTYGIDVEIDPSCINLISDFEFGKEDANGGIEKKMVKDTDTGDTYQKYGHCADAFRYLICSIFEDLYESL